MEDIVIKIFITHYHELLVINRQYRQVVNSAISSLTDDCSREREKELIQKETYELKNRF